MEPAASRQLFKAAARRLQASQAAEQEMGEEGGFSVVLLDAEQGWLSCGVACLSPNHGLKSYICCAGW